jgi:hypothetical protein
VWCLRAALRVRVLCGLPIRFALIWTARLILKQGALISPVTRSPQKRPSLWPRLVNCRQELRRRLSCSLTLPRPQKRLRRSQRLWTIFSKKEIKTMR